MAAERQVGRLPAERGRLVGRRAELDEVARLCARSRLVTVTGVGGVGKTRLARRAADELRPGFADGAWWVELSPLPPEREAPAYTIAEVLPLADQSTRPMLEVVAEYLAGRRTLLVWDTCEHLVGECRETATALLAAAPGLHILATGRRPLGLPAEEVLCLDPLPVPADGAAAGADDALALLADRADAAVPGFPRTPAERTEAVRLCRRLEGLPLALELAAARLHDLPVAELNRRLADRYAVLGDTEDEDYDADPPWHQALRTAIGWSHQLCTPAERLAWARLSVFAGSFDADAAGRVLADEHLPAREVPRLLAALVRDSIVEWTPTGAGERYRMLDTVREYGAHWLHGLGEESVVRRRHRDHYLRLAEAADAAWIGPEQTAWYDRTVTEHANLRAALDFCLAEEDGHGALELGGALWFLWSACGFAKEGRRYLDRSLALADFPGPVWSRALWACGRAAIVLGEAETGLRLAGVFREAVAEEADGTAVFAAAFLEGCGLTMLGRQHQAAAVLDAVPRARPGPGRYAAEWFPVRIARAFVHVHLGEYADALAVTEELGAECARHGETWARAYGDYVHALAALGLGRAEEAAARARTALDGKRRLHDSLGIALAVDVLASATLAAGRAEPAARLLGLAEQIWHALGSPRMGSPELVAARTACEERARGLLGDEVYRAAFAAGHDTDPDTGIAEALVPPGS
ncbi:ATP-binding protein [Streptomyces minutiscleroticus]|uniref:Winged helix-turn-helix domain-containing protein n=1 Tax=Streptomyces minutiscleroticus TaxID=68238 RepID=A0A918ND15_9ACTN|nr:hypothetical protein [Streptomyces minutiscleroticus]GGX58569.1 hypothetical protein GCM10010358_10780 [Streptomyces minutiscleroticus]